MHQIITEGKHGRKKVYYACEVDEYGKVINKTIYDFRVKFNKEDNHVEILVLDQDGNVIPEVYHYLNNLCAACAMTSRKQKAYALRDLYLFCGINTYNPKDMNHSQVKEFINFMMGIDIKNEPGYDISYRTAKVINGKLAHIRTFLNDMDFNINGFVLAKPASKSYTFNMRDMHSFRTRSVVTARTDPKTFLAPTKHVTPEQMKEMLEIMKAENDIRSICLSSLGYGYGCRRGESLGLTEEDIVKEDGDETKYRIILRNRTSDREDQYCKELPHPVSDEIYKSDAYINTWVNIPITKRTYDNLEHYIKISRDPKIVGKEMAKKIHELSAADSVYGKKNNHYVFIGKNGKPYSGQSWNRRLKELFLRVGVGNDEGKRITNCSHRLRHGFGMFHAQYRKEPLSILELMKLMRHASIDSTSVYYNPLPEDELRMRNKLNDEIEIIFTEGLQDKTDKTE